jgi:hypothetical protein
MRRGHIENGGNKFLRWIRTARHASRFDPRLRSFYRRIHARRRRQRPIVGVARKLLAPIYHVLSGNETYHGQRPELLEITQVFKQNETTGLRFRNRSRDIFSSTEGEIRTHEQRCMLEGELSANSIPEGDLPFLLPLLLMSACARTQLRAD